MSQPYTKDLIFNETLKTRNRLQLKCTQNKHSYAEEIKIQVPDGLVFETVIGGRKNGNVVISSIYPGDDFFERLSEHFKHVDNNYKKYSLSIIKDIK